jgi:hypothetical protein
MAIVRREALIGSVIGGAFSACIALITFSKTPWLSANIFNTDLLFQTLGVCFFTAIGVTLGSRPKARKGFWPALEKFSLLPGRIVTRALILTLAGLVFGAAPLALVFSSVASGGASFTVSLIIKTIYGALLSGMVAGLTARAVMGEPQERA